MSDHPHDPKGDPRTWVAGEPPVSGKKQSKPKSNGVNDDLITEGCVADAFAAAHKHELQFCHHTGRWFHWTGGTHWQREEIRRAYRWAHNLARDLAGRSNNFKAMIGAGKASFAGGVERLAQAHEDLAVTSDIWDRDPWLLGTPGGTVDLRTGKLRTAEFSDFITKQTAVPPAETADCPLWLAFLKEATAGDTELIRFLQQWSGYCLTGDTREHALVFVDGPGGNGKSVYQNTVSTLIGDYCCAAAMDTFVASHGDRHPTELAMLKGARIVVAAETEEGRAWHETRINQLTGGDAISARFMRQDFFEFKPQFKLQAIGNHKPSLRNVNDAAKRRINMAPFLFKPAQPDRELETKLKAEQPAILRWMINGCLDWQQNGLVRPQIVLDTTADYFNDQDTFREWIEECCQVGIHVDGQPFADSNSSLFGSWANFAKARGEDPGSQKRFKPAMLGLGYERIKDTPGVRGRGFKGLRVRVYSQHDPDDV